MLDLFRNELPSESDSGIKRYRAIYQDSTLVLQPSDLGYDILLISKQLKTLHFVSSTHVMSAELKIILAETPPVYHKLPPLRATLIVMQARLEEFERCWESLTQNERYAAANPSDAQKALAYGSLILQRRNQLR